MYRLYLKRIFDFFVALISFLLLLPLSVPVYVILFIVNGGSPIFYQLRPGVDGKIFKIFKFKT
ncbi:MAG: lipid carrier--UDP-N-acetylgalactosaminyltransferase, partial [Pedobacter sp.]